MGIFKIIIFYILLLDAIVINVLIFFNNKWYKENIGIFKSIFPSGKGWAVYYLILVLYIGLLTFF